MSKYDPSYMAEAANQVASRMTARVGSTGHTYLREMQAVIERLAVASGTLGKLMNSQSPTETQAAHAKKVGAAAKTVGDAVAKAKDQLNAIMGRGMRDIEARSRAKTGLKMNEFAAEIRASVRILSVEDKLRLFIDLAKEGRGAELAAVIDAPPLLTGVTPEMQQRAKDMLEGLFAKAEVDEREALAQGFADAFDMAAALAAMAGSLGDPRQLAEIERGEEAAAAAVEAFQAATRG